MALKVVSRSVAGHTCPRNSGLSHIAKRAKREDKRSNSRLVDIRSRRIEPRNDRLEIRGD